MFTGTIVSANSSSFVASSFLLVCKPHFVQQVAFLSFRQWMDGNQEQDDRKEVEARIKGLPLKKGMGSSGVATAASKYVQARLGYAFWMCSLNRKHVEAPIMGCWSISNQSLECI